MGLTSCGEPYWLRFYAALSMKMEVGYVRQDGLRKERNFMSSGTGGTNTSFKSFRRSTFRISKSELRPYTVGESVSMRFVTFLGDVKNGGVHQEWIWHNGKAFERDYERVDG